MQVSRVGESKGGLPPDKVVEDESFILKDTQRIIEQYHNLNRHAMLRIVVAPCSPFTVSQDLMRESANLARSYGVSLHTHLAENDNDIAYGLEQFDQRPGDYVDAVIEHVIVPQHAADYYGPNRALRTALEKDQDTWRMIHREAVGNDVGVQMAFDVVDRRLLQPSASIKSDLVARPTCQHQIDKGGDGVLIGLRRRGWERTAADQSFAILGLEVVG